MLVRSFAVLCLGVSLAWTLPASAAQYSAIVIDAKTGEMLHAVEPDAVSYPASLTKMMTVFLAFEAIDAGRLTLDDELSVSAFAASQSPTRLGLAPGKMIRLEDAIKALITKSANDIAVVIAEALAGSEAEFATRMTAKARRLGMAQTAFRNASGLPNPDQISTVRDMARLSRALLTQYPHHYHYFSTAAFEFGGHSYHNHNRLLTRYDGVDGIKTGYTHASGFNLAASVERDGRRLIGVVFGGPSAKWRDDRMIALLDSAYRGGVGPSAAPGSTQVAAKAKKKSAPTVQTVSLEPQNGAAAGGAKSRGFAVQVGAFASHAAAQKAVAAARKSSPDLAKAPVAISQSELSGKLLYLARVTALSEKTAKKSCGELKKKKQACAVVRNDAQTIASIQ